MLWRLDRALYSASALVVTTGRAFLYLCELHFSALPSEQLLDPPEAVSLLLPKRIRIPSHLPPTLRAIEFGASVIAIEAFVIRSS